ncbi:hypothetical protein Hanom_Chr10g00889801 [Helianthus anomalus]
MFLAANAVRVGRRSSFTLQAKSSTFLGPLCIPNEQRQRVGHAEPFYLPNRESPIILQKPNPMVIFLSPYIK